MNVTQFQMTKNETLALDIGKDISNNKTETWLSNIQDIFKNVIINDMKKLYSQNIPIWNSTSINGKIIVF